LSLESLASSSPHSRRFLNKDSVTWILTWAGGQFPKLTLAEDINAAKPSVKRDDGWKGQDNIA
jgi:hypothetical protein